MEVYDGILAYMPVYEGIWGILWRGLKRQALRETMAPRVHVRATTPSAGSLRLRGGGIIVKAAGGRAGEMVTRSKAREEAAVRELAETEEGGELGVVRLAERVGGLVREQRTGGVGTGSEHERDSVGSESDSSLSEMERVERRIRRGESSETSGSECELCESEPASEPGSELGPAVGTHSGMTVEAMVGDKEGVEVQAVTIRTQRHKCTDTITDKTTCARTQLIIYYLGLGPRPWFPWFSLVQLLTKTNNVFVFPGKI